MGVQSICGRGRWSLAWLGLTRKRGSGYRCDLRGNETGMRSCRYFPARPGGTAIEDTRGRPAESSLGTRMACTVPFHRASQIPSTAWHRGLLAQTRLSQTPLAPGLHFCLGILATCCLICRLVSPGSQMRPRPKSISSDYPWSDSHTAGKGGVL